MKSVLGAIWVVGAVALGGCVAQQPSEQESTEGVVGLGEACDNTGDCGGPLQCLSTRAGRVCVEICQSAAECSEAGAACAPIPGQTVGFCDAFGAPQDTPPMDNPPDGPMASYPSGPYGTAVGDVVEDQSVLDSDGSPLSLGDIHSNPANKVLIVYNTVSYCQSCAAKTAELTELDDAFGARGLVPMVALFENLDYQPAAPADAAQYKQRLSLDFTVTADAPGTFHKYFDELVHPMVLIIDVETMTVIYKDVSWLRGPIDEVLSAYF